MTAAIRQRRHRDRQRDGKIMLSIEVDAVDLGEALALAGFVDDPDPDRATLALALQRVVEIWCASAVTRYDMDSGCVR